jgi:hypothetical protein
MRINCDGIRRGLIAESTIDVPVVTANLPGAAHNPVDASLYPVEVALVPSALVKQTQCPLEFTIGIVDLGSAAREAVALAPRNDRVGRVC